MFCARGTTTWEWGAGGHNTPTAKYIGRLKSISSPGGYSETNTNDSLGRIVQQSLTIDGTTYQVNRSYSPTTGWPATLQYPTSTSGYRLQLAYDYQNGQLKRVRNSASATTYWEAVSTNAWGKLQNETFGNGIASYTEYDPANGWLFKRQAGVGGGTGRIDAQVSWDRNGNFTTRQDLKQNLTETFVYDPLNRLDYSQRNGVTNLDVTLDAIGNVSWKSDVGNFSYHATKRRAVVSAGSNSYDYDANGNMKTRNGSTISYTSYNLPTSIPSGSNSSTLAYGAWRNTVKQVAVTSGTTETTIYVAGLVEKVTKGTATEYRHRIDATPGTVAIYTRKSSGSNATYYLHRDHLGSPEMITNASGNSVVKLSFSAYGERRDVDWAGPITNAHLTSASNVTRHGYTDHLHLDSVKLVHMGGRVYDPVIGRFLSRDPYIDGVASSQGANGYAYVWNNPLTRWDPTGFNSTIPGRDHRSWANHGQSERRNDSELEEIVVTGTVSYWELISSLIAHEFRLALIGSGASGSGGEQGGGPGSGGDSGPEGSKEEEPEHQPPPCEYGPSTASGAIRAGGYSGAGGEVTMGLDQGYSFVTARTGFGYGGGVSYNPHGGLPIQPSNNTQGGVIGSVSADFGLSLGVPGTTMAVSFDAALGVAYSNRDGFGWIANFDPQIGALAEKGLRSSGSIGGQLSLYSSPVTSITSTGTCRAN